MARQGLGQMLSKVARNNGCGFAGVSVRAVAPLSSGAFFIEIEYEREDVKKRDPLGNGYLTGVIASSAALDEAMSTAEKLLGLAKKGGFFGVDDSGDLLLDPTTGEGRRLRMARAGCAAHLLRFGQVGLLIDIRGQPQNGRLPQRRSIPALPRSMARTKRSLYVVATPYHAGSSASRKATSVAAASRSLSRCGGARSSTG